MGRRYFPDGTAESQTHDVGKMASRSWNSGRRVRLYSRLGAAIAPMIPQLSRQESSVLIDPVRRH